MGVWFGHFSDFGLLVIVLNSAELVTNNSAQVIVMMQTEKTTLFMLLAIWILKAILLHPWKNCSCRAKNGQISEWNGMRDVCHYYFTVLMNLQLYSQKCAN